MDDLLKRITVNPDIFSGKPIIRGMRISVELILSLLAHQNVKGTTRMAFLNADWRDFQSTPVLKENPDSSITIFDYHRMLSEAGWKVTHRIECPLSSERLSGNQVQKMQDKRILGTVGRTLLIAKRS